MKKGRLLTPPLVSSVLPGITRDTILALARARDPRRGDAPSPGGAVPGGRGVPDGNGGRGHAHPVGGQDRRREGLSGPVTEEALQRAFFDVIECRVPDEFGWLTYVREVGAASAAPARRTTAG